MKVKFLPYQPHCFSFGGFHIQQLNTLEAVRKSGVSAEKMDIWSRDSDFDILHCWGLGFPHAENMTWARNAGKRVVLTALLGYYETFNERFRHFLSTHIRKARYLIEIANEADAIVLLNDLQAQACHEYFKVPPEKIYVIPNIVHERFFDLSKDDTFSTSCGLKDYVLIVGGVTRRKNQLNLAKACNEANVPLVIIGKVQDGEQEYGRLIEEEIKKSNSIVWIQGLPAHSPELASAYKGSVMVGLPSFTEQQPITLLEAVASRKPLLVADRAYARQKYFVNAKLVNPESVPAIAAGIAAVKAEPLKYIPSDMPMSECHEASVGQMYKDVYAKVLSR